MPLVNAKCENCGSILKIESDRETAFCEYCGAKYIVEQAIEYYNVQNNVYAQNVNMTAKGEAEKERLLENAQTYLDLFEYKKSEEIYNQIIEDYPAEYRGWYGLAAILSRQFTKADSEPEEYSRIELYLSRALKFADSSAKNKVKNDAEKLDSLRKRFIEEKKAELESLTKKAKDLGERIKTENEKYDEELKKLDELTKSKEKNKPNKHPLWLIPASIALLFLVGLIGGEKIRLGIFVLALFVLGIELIILLIITLKNHAKKAILEKHKNQQAVVTTLANSISQHKTEFYDIVNKIKVTRGIYKL